MRRHHPHNDDRNNMSSVPLPLPRLNRRKSSVQTSAFPPFIQSLTPSPKMVWIPLLLLLVAWTDAAQAMCFRAVNSTRRKAVVDRPDTVDQYHCKILCAEKITCLSFTFPDSKCILLGAKDHDGTCMMPYVEWIKKTADADCTTLIAQPLIDTGYVPNPALSLATPAQGVTINTKEACAGGTVLDVTLPDNSHRIDGNNFNYIQWDGKLGSWTFTKQRYTDATFTTSANTSMYIRAARCWSADPKLYSDTTSCGGPISTQGITEAGYVSDGAVSVYGALNCCLDRFAYIADINPFTPYPLLPSNTVYVTCIDRTWMLFIQMTGRIVNARKLISATCVKT